MFRTMSRGISILIIMVLLAGCAGSGSAIRTRSYVVEKERVDQNMEGGNYGYIFGTPVPEDRSSYKKTREVYVLEFTKEDVDEQEESFDTLLPPPPPRPQVTSTPPPRREPRREPVDEYDAISLPNFDDDIPESEPEPVMRAMDYTDYTIQKNDTLQKISKKFYDTYRKWPQIYEANKDKIKDPNRIKPGVTIRIPAE